MKRVKKTEISLNITIVVWLEIMLSIYVLLGLSFTLLFINATFLFVISSLISSVFPKEARIETRIVMTFFYWFISAVLFFVITNNWQIFTAYTLSLISIILSIIISIGDWIVKI